MPATAVSPNLGVVTTLRSAISVAMLILVCSACAPRPSGNLDVQTDCGSVIAERVPDAAGVAMNVRAAGCPDPAEAVDRIAAAVWRSLRQPVDRIRVEVANRDKTTRATEEFCRKALTERFGAGPRGPVVASAEPDSGTGLWLMLPVAWLVIGLGALALTYRAVRAGAVLFVIR